MFGGRTPRRSRRRDRGAAPVATPVQRQNVEESSGAHNVTVDLNAAGDMTEADTSNRFTDGEGDRDSDRDNVVNATVHPDTDNDGRAPLNANEDYNASRVHRMLNESLADFRVEILDLISTSFRNLNTGNAVPATSERHDYRSDGNPPRRTANTNHDNIDTNSGKILNIIKSWGIRFTGDSSHISVDEFIYRVNTLTCANLRGNFEMLCEHIHILFEGKALTWFWRFHRNCEILDWSHLRDALKRQFKDFDTDSDVKDDIRRRKQRQNESFDDYFDSIMSLCDKLREPFTDQELCEAVIRNLNPDLRYELLHLNINNVSQLRREVRIHEKFMKDMQNANYGKRLSSRRQISELDLHKEHIEDSLTEDIEVCAVNKSGNCWNCGELGHNFFDCLEPRAIFCYGCGIPNTYRPQCANCSKKRGNEVRDVRTFRDGHPKL